MKISVLRISTRPAQASVRRTDGERGSALVASIFILALLGVIAMTVLGVVTTETRIAGSDLERTKTFYAAASAMEKMTSDFSALFSRTSRPTLAQLNHIAADSPPELVNEGFTLFPQTIDLDNVTLTSMRQTQGISGTAYPDVTVPSGPYAGLTASVAPYILETTATSDASAQVRLKRQINNYLIPIFQFGMFSNGDLEVYPGPAFTFNGRIHANGNLYLNGNTTFLSKVTTANELVREVVRNGGVHDGAVSFLVGTINVPLTLGSVFSGPNLPGATAGERGYFPGSPAGTSNVNWKNTSVASPQIGVPNQFGGQVLTRTTGISPLLLPMQLDGNPPREIIKRRMPNDDVTLSESRYHSKAQIRILLDDEASSAGDRSGITAGKGVLLSTFKPALLPAGTVAAGGGRALWRISNAGAYTDTSSTCLKQGSTTGLQADTVRGIRSASATSSNGVTIPAGSGITGRILIEIIASDGTARDVTTQILSMGMTVGEPNAILHLQRPLWAAYTQGSRDSTGGNNYLTYILNSTYLAADGEINTSSAPVQDATYGFLTSITEEAGIVFRNNAPTAANTWNSIVPINIYNVREGRINTSLDANTVYERGVMSVVELNMRNFARWMDGVYDTNLLAGTTAVSANIHGSDGYIIYLSDRRGDKVKAERDSVGPITTSNGMVDNEDIYGPNSQLDAGEDVIDAGTDGSGNPKQGTLQRDLTELPDPAVLAGTSSSDRVGRANTVAAWRNPGNFFRRSVRIFDGETLQISGAANKLSATRGITIASENLVYIWGNYNTTGINIAPAEGLACLNDATGPCTYTGNQVPSSIVVDAFFPLSKTWFDSLSALYPEDVGIRVADRAVALPVQETAVRAGIIAGINLSALSNSPDAGNSSAGESRLNGGMHNFPRFMEGWRQRWNFAGSLIPLFNSTQALGQYNANSTIYGAPLRNWAFDSTFQDPNRLPPGTPQFQYVQPTAFRQIF